MREHERDTGQRPEEQRLLCPARLGDGRLRFLSGASNVTVHTDPWTADLYRARFEGPLPGVRVEGGAVAVEYPWTLHPFDWRKRGADVVLNGSIPWKIGLSGGLSRVHADSSGPRLDSFSEVSIRFDGGASDVVASPQGRRRGRSRGGWSQQVGARRPALRRHRR